MKSSITFALLFLSACSGAPFTVAPSDVGDSKPIPLEATAFPPEAAMTAEAGAPAPEASASEADVPEANTPDVPMPEAGTPVEASTLPEATPPPPVTFCCRLPGPTQSCPGAVR